MITSIKQFKESLSSNIVEIIAIISIDRDLTTLEEIYSKIRSLMGVTVLSTTEILDDKYQDNNNYQIQLNIKIDKFPFFNYDDVSFTYKKFIKQINNIIGVNSFKIKNPH